MTDRLALYFCSTHAELTDATITEIKALGARVFPLPGANSAPLNSCIDAVARLGPITVIVQRRVFDPDFSAEYSVYYSQQFGNVPRTCTRLHFFQHDSAVGEDPLNFLDRVPEDCYLGLLTLRPVPRASVGATILAARVASPHFVCSSDRFPVHIAGRHFKINGTPFMQQDNAVAVCAQASIWMALRTLRRREGDRAHNPAQITDAATRYLVSDRTRPNKGGLTTQQMAEAVRAAGYSPLSMALRNPLVPMQPAALVSARRQLHAYLESDIPVLLALNTPAGGHAVAAIGHTWNAAPSAAEMVWVHHVSSGINMQFCHAVSWVPDLLIHNDNSGPYQVLPSTAPNSYSLSQAFQAIPLLPVDVFLTGDEALVCGLDVLGQLVTALRTQKSPAELDALAKSLVLRLLLVDKSRLRQWAVTTPMAPELSAWLRMQDLPRRVWVFEIHQKADFGAHQAAPQNTLVGMILIDPTGDALDANANIIMTYFNFPVITGVGHGTVVYGDPATVIQTSMHGAMRPLQRAR